MHNLNLAPEASNSSILSTNADVSFSDLDLDPKLVGIISKHGITVPTPIQARAIPVLNRGQDVVGIAQTGTGKTLAFVLPIIQKLQKSGGRTLILVPTRELAIQVDETIRSITAHLTPKLWSAVLIGGASMQLQRERLRRRPAFLIATPGRLRDHLDQRNLNLSEVSVVVLDEADRMLDMGFAPEVRRILQLVPKVRQTMLFSATMPPEIESLAASYLSKPVRVEVSPPGTSVKKIHQEICFLTGGEGKIPVLKTLLDEHEGLTLIFTRTKHGATALLGKIKTMGHSAAEIHSNRSLGQRRQALDGFKSGRYRILVATDIAARGIDVDDVELVINYDLPDASDDYVHRIGRTGRAGKSGKAISLALQIESSDVEKIERITGVPMTLSPHSAPRLAIYTRGGFKGGSRRGNTGGGGRRPSNRGNGNSRNGEGRSSQRGGGRSYRR